VLVERQQGAEAAARERLTHARDAVVMQSAEIDALLEVDLRAAGRLQRPRPVVVRIDVVGPDPPGLGSLRALALGHVALHRRSAAEAPRPARVVRN